MHTSPSQYTVALLHLLFQQSASIGRPWIDAKASHHIAHQKLDILAAATAAQACFTSRSCKQASMSSGQDQSKQQQQQQQSKREAKEIQDEKAKKEAST